RRAEHHAIGKIQVRREGGGISRAEAAIQGPRWLIERGLESLREVRLKDVAGEDVLAHARHRGEIAAVRERRTQCETRVPPVVCEVARRAALKGWQSRYGFGRMRREQRPNRVERVAVDGVPRSLEPVEIDALGPRSLAPYHRHRIGREKRVTTEPWALSCAVE